MGTLDATAYKRDVLSPWTKDPALRGALQSSVSALQANGRDLSYLNLDLRTLFAVPSGPLTDQALTAHAVELDKAFNKSRQLPAVASLMRLKSLLSDQGKFTDPTFWAGLGAQQAQAQRAATDAAARDLAAESVLKVISRSSLGERLAALGLPGQGAAELERALAAHQVRVFDDLELPAPSSLQGLQIPWRKVREHPEYRSIFDLLVLHQRRPAQGGRCIDALSEGGRPLTVKDVADSHKHSQSVKDSNATQDAQKFLAELRKRSGDELRQVVLATVTERAQQLLADRVPLVRVPQTLVAEGVDEYDAARIVWTLNAGGQAQQSALDPGAVRSLLADGDLAGAERTLEALRDDPETAAERRQLAEQIVQLRQRKGAAMTAYRAALAARDYARAEDQLNVALRIDRADASIGDLLGQLPPSAPRVSVRITPEGPLITWSEADGGAGYSLFRSATTSFGDSPQGSPVAAALAQTTHVDRSAPVGELLHYAVVATRPGGVPSAAGRAEVLFAPAPTSVTASPSNDAIMLSGSVPAEAEAVVVQGRAADGHRVSAEVRGTASHRFGGLHTGQTYRFALTARYHTRARGSVLSEEVTASATPRGTARPVTDLQLDEDGVAPGSYRAEWTAVPGFVTELWLLPRGAEPGEGQASSADALRRVGARRVETVVQQGQRGRVFATFRAPQDVCLLCPFVVTDDGLITGRGVLAGQAPPVRNARAEEFRDQLRLTWDWPDGDYIAEVRWTTPQGVRTRRVTRARYRADGAVYLGDPRTVTDVSVGTVAKAGDEEFVSGRVHIPTQQRAQAPSLSYRVTLQKSFLGKVRATVDVQADGPAVETQLGLYVTERDLMPLTPDQATLVASFTPDFSAATSHSVTVELGRLRSPFWVRVFADHPDRTKLLDPPISQLKG